PILRHDVMELSDLKPGMVLKGTVRNIVDFGAFVDIGVHQDGLVHISHMTEKFIKHPLEVVKVGDIVDVEVLDVDMTHQRIALSMRIGFGDVAGENGKHESPEGNKSGAAGKGNSGGKKQRGNKDNKKQGKERVAGSTFGSSMADLFKDIKL
ncbi:MAG: S1 RNA-binding domain-containing protein, partial [Lachnospiraceae bacterium]|nr:S1 RNA-binding domain-containing protein [Lachnospiraceae bacterium]